MILAIGGQCRESHLEDLQYSKDIFIVAQKSAFAEMLCDPSLDMIAVFLFMAFYMLGACRRNGAFMYLGVAVKAAYVLGLHKSDLSNHTPDGEKRVRYVSERLVHIRLLNLLMIIQNMAKRVRIGYHHQLYPRSTNHLFACHPICITRGLVVYRIDRHHDLGMYVQLRALQYPRRHPTYGCRRQYLQAADCRGNVSKTAELVSEATRSTPEPDRRAKQGPWRPRS